VVVARGIEVDAGAAGSPTACAWACPIETSKMQQNIAATHARIMLRGNMPRLARWSLEDRLHISLITICIPKLPPPSLLAISDRH
jgi:hypothetical protein